LISLIKVHHPERTTAVKYLTEWMTRCTYEGLTPLKRLHVLEAARDFDVLTPEGRPTVQLHHEYPLKHVHVARRVDKRSRSELVALPKSFAAYLSHREAQGVSRQTAEEEWNGMQILQD
jgi:hypothetical protein